MISINDKKYFIWWFLNHYELKIKESKCILKYIVNHESLLSRVHFVRHAEFCPKGFIISSECSSETPFRFYKQHVVTTDIEKAFHDIRINQDEPLYIQLSFEKAHQNALYAGILIDHPFLSNDHFITHKDRENAEQLLNKTLYEYKRETLDNKINSALDRHDKQKFNQLVKQLHALEAADKKK